MSCLTCPNLLKLQNDANRRNTPRARTANQKRRVDKLEN